MREVDYYNKSITESGFEKALDHYWDYMHTQKQDAEFTEEDWELSDFEDLSQSILSHVIYHAEMEGFVINDYMI